MYLNNEKYSKALMLKALVSPLSCGRIVFSMWTSTSAIILWISSIVVVIAIIVTITISCLIVVSTIAFGYWFSDWWATKRLFKTIPGIPVTFWRATGGKKYSR